MKGEVKRCELMDALFNFVKRYKDAIVNRTWSLKKLVIKIFKNLRSLIRLQILSQTKSK